MKILVVVDMQKDFIDGSLGTKEAQEIVPAVCEKIRTFDGEIIVTKDTHKDHYLETQEGVNLPVPHCIEGTVGWTLDDKVQDAIRARDDITAYTITKPTFGSVELGHRLSAQGSDNIEEVVFVGLCTDICVISNAMLLKAFLPEVKITVDAACCAGVTPESHENALRAMKMCQMNIENWEG